MTISREELSNIAQEVVRKEAAAVARLSGFIDEQFISVLELIFNSKGRLIITGIGKSAIIANKVVATLNSTGTPAVFMHAADAIHGDLGIIQKDDIVLCLSKSGNTAEIKVLVPWIKKMGNKIIGMVSDTNSFLAQHSDFIIKASVDSEACPNNLAPTSSTTAQLVMGDALAVCLLKMRGFSQEDFARVHPGGSLGKKLYTRVSDIIDRAVRPMVREDESIQNTILNISANRLGATVVLHENGDIAGIITDGDVRRMVEKGTSIHSLRARDIMSSNPKKVESDELAVNAFNMMEQNKITSLVVLEKGKYIGLVHIHDILREGIV
ncbi:Arabinose 5-phosphate isomerase [Bacteroidales bacterium CF]|jgi:KpsF/GutQ family protein|nr:Arabinose 5-phosphate isomerase [Bacteroidales bacterium CF]